MIERNKFTGVKEMEIEKKVSLVKNRISINIQILLINR